MISKIISTVLLLIVLSSQLYGQGYFQQYVNYKIDVDVDHTKHQLKGHEILEYKNNSADTLTQLFFHLYWNAFQPGSMMDVRSQELGQKMLGDKADWDKRVQSRISKLTKGEEGFCHIKNIKINGIAYNVEEIETIAQIKLKTPILPNTTTLIELDFIGQIPKQIRRSGRFNSEGVQYSSSQWYPKICAYDQDGWHPNPYIAREFYGEWGDFTVNLQLEKSFVVAASGTLQQSKTKKFYFPKNRNKKIWHFYAPNVHDFMWAADPTYIKKTVTINPEKPIELAVYYKKTTPEQAKKWENILQTIAKAYPFIKTHFGDYAYASYSFIQGGDGGMEYPNATLLKSYNIGTAIHEWMHSWYQMMLATNESLFAWMDEGFTSWASNEISQYLQLEDPSDRLNYYNGYFYLHKIKLAEPATKHADHFNRNIAYSITSYTKGAMFLEQLGYIIGRENLDATLLRYYKQWRFKHPRPSDFIKIAEQVSQLQLDWFLSYWIATTETIDYGIKSVDNGTVTLERIDNMPMPIDIKVQYDNGEEEAFHIPLTLMYGHKSPSKLEGDFTILKPWKWTHPTYQIETNKKIISVTIDPSKRLADINKQNNTYYLSE